MYLFCTALSMCSTLNKGKFMWYTSLKTILDGNIGGDISLSAYKFSVEIL